MIGGALFAMQALAAWSAVLAIGGWLTERTPIRRVLERLLDRWGV